MTTYSTFPIWSVFADVFNKFTLAIKLVAFCHVLAPPILSGFHFPRQYVRQHRIHCNAHNAIQQFHRRRISAAVLISQKRLHTESRVCRHIADIGNIPTPTNSTLLHNLIQGNLSVFLQYIKFMVYYYSHCSTYSLKYLKGNGSTVY